MIHGNEPLPSVPIIRRVLELLDPSELSGTVMAVPVCNPVAAGALSRNSPLDGANLNGVFAEPGEDSTIQPVLTISEQMAATLTESFLPHLDYHIDFHTGDDRLSAHMVEFTDDPESTAMARAFNMPILLRDAWGESQFWGASARLGRQSDRGRMRRRRAALRRLAGTWRARRLQRHAPIGHAAGRGRNAAATVCGGQHPRPSSQPDSVAPRARAACSCRRPEINAEASFAGQPIEGERVLAQLLNPYDLTMRETFETPFSAPCCWRRRSGRPGAWPATSSISSPTPMRGALGLTVL